MPEKYYKMDLKLKIYGALCATSEFIINGIDASSGDFGTQDDIKPENAEDYGCGNMTFERKPSTQLILDKYGITEEEYNEVATRLEIDLSFGSCGWCV